MTTSESYHYVLTMGIQKVTKTLKKTATGPRWEEDKIEEVDRNVNEITKIIIRDKVLAELIDRGKKHLDLVEDDNL